MSPLALEAESDEGLTGAAAEPLSALPGPAPGAAARRLGTQLIGGAIGGAGIVVLDVPVPAALAVLRGLVPLLRGSGHRLGRICRCDAGLGRRGSGGDGGSSSLCGLRWVIRWNHPDIPRLAP